MEFTKKELDKIRQWFDCVQDIHPKYFEPYDYRLAERIYTELNMRVTNSIKEGIKSSYTEEYNAHLAALSGELAAYKVK